MKSQKKEVNVLERATTTYHKFASKKAINGVIDAEKFTEERTIESIESCISKLQYRILLVDDDADVREYYSMLLKERCGFRNIELASSGAEAAAKVLTNTYDIVLSDYRMEDGDGAYLYRFLQEHDIKTQFLIISGYDDFEVTNLKKAGIRVLNKNASPDEFIEVIEHYYVTKLRKIRAELLGEIND